MTGFVLGLLALLRLSFDQLTGWLAHLARKPARYRQRRRVVGRHSLDSQTGTSWSTERERLRTGEQAVVAAPELEPRQPAGSVRPIMLGPAVDPYAGVPRVHVVRYPQAEIRQWRKIGAGWGVPWNANTWETKTLP